ncbi:hypothetical protein [Pseudomonas corrugata]|uniref:hypothetical protein n=1 Tax=Pseudomonas corrugata TaxID=47879 RepID=UPI0022342047|nr:hypothetical protein [Pseudomonas corrugata]UZE07760.1 hypothetical protein LOY65_07520 [Pseudomonas corrugata]
MEQDRVSYSEIKKWVLENFWDGCRDHGPLIKSENENVWSLEQIASDVYDGYAGGVGSFDSPLEYLMLEVVSLVLSCWYPNQIDYHKRRIYDLLSENDLTEMLENIPSDESEEFKHDLEILNIICDKS